MIVAWLMMIPNTKQRSKATNEPNPKIKLSFIPTTLTFDENLELYGLKAEEREKIRWKRN